MRITLKQILLVTLMGIFLWGCKTTRKTKKPDLQTHHETLINEVMNAEPKFRNIEFKRMSIGLNLNEKSHYNSNATCKIIPDSVIHISVQPFFGIEMVVVRLTPDQILVVDKIKNIYYQSDYLLFEQQFGLEINYSTFESLFTNKLFTIGAKDKNAAKLTNTTDKNDNSILVYKNVSLSQHFFLNENFRIREVAINSTSGNEQFMAFYTDFATNTGNLLFPSGIRFQLKNNAEIYSINMSINRLAVDETIDIPFININQYRQGNILSLFK